MSIEECPHCFTPVLYGSSSICLSCGVDKNEPAKISKDEYELNGRIVETNCIIEEICKKGVRHIIVGFILVFLSIALYYYMAAAGSSMYLYGAFGGGFLQVVLGIKYMVDAQGVRKENIDLFT